MKPTIINHPFHIIKLGYVSEAPLSTLEQEAIEKYIELHNRSQAYKEVLTRLHTHYINADKALQQCQGLFNNLQNEYLLITPVLHYLREGRPYIESEIESIDESERVCYDTQPLLTQLHNFNHTYDAYIDGLRAAEQEFATTEQQQEELKQLFDVFDDHYFSPIIRDYKNMEIDSFTLDENFDGFRGAFSELIDFVSKMCEVRANFLDQQNQLHNKILKLDKDIAALFAALNDASN